MRVSAPADRRFRRKHVRPARRRRPWAGQGLRMLRLAVAAAVALYAVYRGAALVLSAEALYVTHFTVVGTERLSNGEVIALIEGVRGQSLVTVDLEPWRQKLKQSPWVADAAMRRVFPGTIAVAISERQPMGIGRLRNDLYLIDQRGTIIDQYGPNYAEFDLPIIDGLEGPPRDGAPMIDDGRAALASRLLASVQARPDLANRISQVDVSDVRDAAVILKDDTAVVRVGDDQFVERLQSYLDLAPTLRERVDSIDYVDLRFDERVYVRPHPSGRGAKGEGRVSGQGRVARREGRGTRGAVGTKGRKGGDE
jgi:cell division protein FtsQ